MASPKPTVVLFTTVLLLLTHLHTATAVVTLTQIRTLLSLSHSLSTRVATLRRSRGDLSGARRAEFIASRVRFGLGLRSWPTLFSLTWDYLRNYAWRDAVSFRDAVGVAADVNELMGLFTELARLRSDSERASWVATNYRFVIRALTKMFSRLLSVFTKSGPVREFVETLQEEIEGDFVKDLLEVGFNDLKGVTQILKDLASQYTKFDPKQEL